MRTWPQPSRAFYHSLRARLLVLCIAINAVLPALAADSKDPVVSWGFESDLPAPGSVVGNVAIAEGAQPERYPSFQSQNRCLTVSRDGYVRIQDEGDESLYDFDNGDELTVEAWIQVDSIRDNAYIIGKGRTRKSGAKSLNQNWAIRLRKQNGTGRLNFLFRSRATESHPGDWHRWTSSQGIAPGPGWHHIAISYRFGEPESLVGIIDGQQVDGKWDMGGATSEPPVVDNDDVWIGAAMDAVASNKFVGAIDELKVYRHLIAVDSLKERFEYIPREVVRPELTQDSIVMEMFGPHGAHDSFPLETDSPRMTWRQNTLAMTRIPNCYDDWGVRDDWTTSDRSTMLVRGWTLLQLDPGDYEFIVRSRGLARLTIDDQVIAETPPQRSRTGAHHVVDPLPEVPIDGMRPHYMNDHEAVGHFRSAGGTHLVRFDVNIGSDKFCLRVGETSVSVARPGEMFRLLSPSTDHQLTDNGWEEFEQEERRLLDELDRRNRRQAATAIADYWNARHQEARRKLEDHTSVEQSIDSIISKRIAEHHRSLQSAQDRSPNGQFYWETVRPILEEHCNRCHLEKAQGELRLDDHANLLAGGESGEPAVVPGKASESLLLELVAADQDDYRMPPEGKGLNDREVATLRDWINAGAEMPPAAEVAVEVPEQLDDLSFLRRVFLDTVGVVPTLDEIDHFLRDPVDLRRQRVIDRLLKDNRWADHWVSYWQDVFAENPNLLKPKLNNTGPFRFWIHDALEDNKPLDQFATELIMMRGSKWYGGAAGFEEASLNDVPMAAKAHVIGTAFLGVEMKCARCHDAPYHDWGQQDLFSMAAMLHRGPLKLPESSTVPPAFFEHQTRQSLIVAKLKTGDSVDAHWPLENIKTELGDRWLLDPSDSREQLALRVTGSRRFAEVMANRIWEQLMGQAIVGPVHDWHGHAATNPELLQFLADELIRLDFDQRAFAATILASDVYQRQPTELDQRGFFAGPVRRRMTAEQIVDSSLVAVGQSMETEILALDLEGTFKPDWFFNFGKPSRAWEFTTLANERDRPSLALPRAQAIADVLKAFGWRNYRAEPISQREHTPDLVQPGALANGTFGSWLTRLSDDSELTHMAVEADSLARFVDDLFLRLLTRHPSQAERERFSALLSVGFDNRVVPADKVGVAPTRVRYRNVSWSNHLNTEANKIKVQMEQDARRGEPPTRFLTDQWRRRAEDAVWSLLNSPEMILVP